MNQGNTVESKDPHAKRNWAVVLATAVLAIPVGKIITENQAGIQETISKVGLWVQAAMTVFHGS